MENMILSLGVGLGRGGEGRGNGGGGRGIWTLSRTLIFFYIKLSRSLYTVLTTIRWLHHAAVG
jgi:hypothetical protein